MVDENNQIQIDDYQSGILILNFKMFEFWNFDFRFVTSD